MTERFRTVITEDYIMDAIEDAQTLGGQWVGKRVVSGPHYWVGLWSEHIAAQLRAQQPDWGLIRDKALMIAGYVEDEHLVRLGISR